MLAVDLEFQGAGAFAGEREDIALTAAPGAFELTDTVEEDVGLAKLEVSIGVRNDALFAIGSDKGKGKPFADVLHFEADAESTLELEVLEMKTTLGVQASDDFIDAVGVFLGDEIVAKGGRKNLAQGHGVGLENKPGFVAGDQAPWCGCLLGVNRCDHKPAGKQCEAAMKGGYHGFFSDAGLPSVMEKTQKVVLIQTA